MTAGQEDKCAIFAALIRFPMKRLSYFLAVVLLLSSVSPVLAAQREDDALCIWSTTVLKKSFGKDDRWGVGVLQEYRHKIRNGVSETDQWFLRPSVSYSVLPWLKVQYQMDFAATSSGFNMLFMPEVSLSHKVGDFLFSFRQRVMTTLQVAQNTNVSVLRTRARVDYRIPETPLTVIFAAEPYWCRFSATDDFSWFQKCRWYAGVDIRLTDSLTFSPHYNCQAYHNHKGRYDRRTYDDHVIYFTLTVKL